MIASVCCFAGVALASFTVGPKPKKKFIETANMDSSVKPSDDFYKFVNGKWIAKTEIPATESGIGAFLDVFNATKKNLKAILDDVSKGNQVPGSIEQKVGDFYASGLDSVTIEKRGIEPVKPYLSEVDAIKDNKDVVKLIQKLQTENVGLLFNMYVGPDDKNSSLNVLNFYQGGIGLPEREYYFKTDPATVAIQNAYKTYLKKLFLLTGTADSNVAKKDADAVYELEKEIAKSHRKKEELRNPQLNYNKLAVNDLNKKMPSFGWNALLKGLGLQVDSVLVGQPAFYAKADSLLKTRSVTVWKTYLKAHILTESAGALSSPFVNASFEYTKAISGQQKIKPRWERINQSVDANLGEALGQLYVKKHFTEDAKKRMAALIENLSAAFEARMAKLDWMSDATKSIAREKLHSFLKKIGYPSKWRDYSKVNISRTKYFENLVACSRNDFQFQMAKVNKAVDKTEWGMTPPTINAYYNPSFNEIVFPAGILQFPFFDMDADDAINYGGIGMVIGHEMTHAFDDQGAQYDKEGNLKNWWAPDDSAKFVAKSQKVIDEYAKFTVLDTLHVNGELTTGENMADIGGIAIAFDAFKMTAQGKGNEKIDGFTPDQRFFLSFAQIWRSKQKEQRIRQRINTDPHSPPIWRVNAPLMNFTPFYTAFNVKPGDKMYKPESERIKIW